MDKGIIQTVIVVAITVIIVISIMQNQIEFAQNVGMVGVGAMAGFLGNEALNSSDAVA